MPEFVPTCGTLHANAASACSCKQKGGSRCHGLCSTHPIQNRPTQGERETGGFGPKHSRCVAPAGRLVPGACCRLAQCAGAASSARHVMRSLQPHGAAGAALSRAAALMPAGPNGASRVCTLCGAARCARQRAYAQPQTGVSLPQACPAVAARKPTHPSPLAPFFAQAGVRPGAASSRAAALQPAPALSAASEACPPLAPPSAGRPAKHGGPGGRQAAALQLPPQRAAAQAAAAELLRHRELRVGGARAGAQGAAAPPRAGNQAGGLGRAGAACRGLVQAWSVQCPRNARWARPAASLPCGVLGSEAQVVPLQKPACNSPPTVPCSAAGGRRAAMLQQHCRPAASSACTCAGTRRAGR